MKRQSRTLVGSLAMIAGSLFILGTATEARATSNGCFLPSVAANLLWSSIFGFESNVKACKEQCDKIKLACQKIVRVSAKCVKASIQGEFGFEKVGCRDEGSDQKSCKGGAKEQASDDFGFLRDDKKVASGVCKDRHSECRSDCEDD